MPVQYRTHIPTCQKVARLSLSYRGDCNENIHSLCSANHEQNWQSYPVDQPGKVANPARGRLNRENEYFRYIVEITRRTTHESTQLCCITHVSGSTTTQLCCLTHMSGSTSTTQLCCITHPSGKYYHSVVLYKSFEWKYHHSVMLFNSREWKYHHSVVLYNSPKWKVLPLSYVV